ncbi:MAG TPA: MsnO8 family LLM class oxidoreductase, partial [Allosphingosinicella sp.]
LASDENQFPQDVVELMGYFEQPNGRAVRAVPGEGLSIPVWILGSSLFGAQLAAMLGLPYAFASHFAPAQMMDAIQVYRERFQPSAQLERPYVMLGFNAFAAESGDKAELLATSVQQAFVNLRTGNPGKLPPPVPGYSDTLPLEGRALLRQVLTCSAVGDASTVKARIEAFVERTGADELMITSQIYDHEARLRSYEIVAEATASHPGEGGDPSG